MGMGEAVTVAGIGCRRGVSVAAVLAAVEAARGGRRLDALATVPAKRGEPALAEAARTLGLPLVVGAVADGDPRLLSRSAASRAATGSGAASEAAALAAAGPEARLVGPRLALGPVTCAIAVVEGGA
jgi:cobalt-precorrin 5A hydrolase